VKIHSMTIPCHASFHPPKVANERLATQAEHATQPEHAT
jgi:hypothetical protein